MEFNIKNYIWNIFEIMESQHISDSRLAFNMFIVNLELGRERYHGARYVRYGKLHNVWTKMTDDDKHVQEQIYNRIMSKLSPALIAAFSSRNRFEFEILAHLDLISLGIDLRGIELYVVKQKINRHK